MELASLAEGVGVRDSKNPDGPRLHLTPTTFRALLADLKQRGPILPGARPRAGRRAVAEPMKAVEYEIWAAEMAGEDRAYRDARRGWDRGYEGDVLEG